MIVVSDATPLHYLVLIGHEHLLPRLFGDVTVPPRVVTELTSAETPLRVRHWVSRPPAWLRERAPDRLLDVRPRVDAGELEAISLAVELGADLLLADDLKARQAAAGLRLSVRGTLGILLAAGREDVVDLDAAVDLLAATNFRASADLLETVRRRGRTGRG